MTQANNTHLYRQQATPCQCDEPFGDEREGVCGKCGRQVKGYEIPSIGAFGFKRDESTFARPSRKFRPAA